MLKHYTFFLSRKWFVILVTIITMLGVGTIWYIRSTQDDNVDTVKIPETLDDALVGYTYRSSPDDVYFNRLKKFIDETENQAEKARAYRVMAEAYYAVNRVQEAVDSYKYARELFSLSAFSEEDMEKIEEAISMLEEQLSYTPEVDTEIERQRGTPR